MELGTESTLIPAIIFGRNVAGIKGIRALHATRVQQRVDISYNCAKPQASPTGEHKTQLVTVFWSHTSVGEPELVTLCVGGSNPDIPGVRARG
jgi:hypothetical protein